MVNKAKSFEFVRYQANLGSGELKFDYKILLADGQSHIFQEILNFPKTTLPEEISPQLIDAMMQSLHLILGISYYKLYCPKEIKISGFSINKEQADFWNAVYTKGLGEFFYKNKIDYRNLIKFPYSDSLECRPTSIEVEDKYLLGIGGGKDSIVAAEILKEEKKKLTSFILGGYALIEKIIEIIGGDRITVERKIDPRLFELNNSKDTYNGHIPISAIYAFVGLFTAILGKFKYLTFANEKSANFGNVEYLGEEINHQWSKSKEFERLFAKYVQTFITGSVQYFSMLRPFSDIQICRKFANYEKYFPFFSSCNSNFKISGKGTEKKWCGQCPKCAFVFCTLAAFISKPEMIKIFGKNLLDDPVLIDTYKRLLGRVSFKPFECVGTSEETKEAFYLLSENKDYKNDLAVKMFKTELSS